MALEGRCQVMTADCLAAAERLEPAARWRPALDSVKLLLPVWGRRHLDLFLNASLPTLLWPGNVPSLAATLACEFVVMTDSDDADTIAAHPNWQRLRQFCPVRIVAIDDLISDASYAVTLTLAYAQAIRASGAALLDTGSFFLTSDFLVADGGLAAVLARLRAGASGVLTGSFQVAAESSSVARPFAADTPMEARALMRWSVDRLHPDTRRATVNAGYRHVGSVNRLFWRLDDATLLGRFYLMHMIAIRPEVGDFTVGAACDYSFIPELCPSGRVVVLTDSDEYFCAELQPAGDARGPDRTEALDPRRVAAELSRWTTARHRENAWHTVLYHAGEVPPRFAEFRDRADLVIAEIGHSLARVPQPHRGHPYWIGGTALRRATTGRGDREAGSGRPGAATRLWWRMRLSAFGRPPDVRPWHPRWPDFAALRARLRGAILILSDEPRSFAGWVARFAPGAMSLPRSALEAPPVLARIEAAGPFARCLLVVPEDGTRDLGRSVDFLSRQLGPGGEILILAISGLRDDPALLDPAAFAAIEASLRRIGWPMQTFQVAASPIRRRVQQVMVDAARATRRRSGLGAALAFATCGALAVASCGLNQLALRGPARRPWSSALFVLRPQAAEQTGPIGENDVMGE